MLHKRTEFFNSLEQKNSVPNGLLDIKWITVSQSLYNSSGLFFIIRALDHQGDCFCNLIHIVFLQAYGVDCCGSKTNTTGYKWRFRIIWNRIFVTGDICIIQEMFHLFAGNAGSAQVYQHQMIVGTAGYNVYVACSILNSGSCI